jgi:hypothetical protein
MRVSAILICTDNALKRALAAAAFPQLGALQNHLANPVHLI